jgi:hypothetical protein
MWIIQEIQQACKLSIHCGTKHVEDSAFLCLDRILSISPLRKIEDFTMSLALLLLRQRYKTIMSLPTWLYYCLQWSCICTEPRDIIYALLGVSSESDVEQVMPDYSKSVLELYADVLTLLSNRTSRAEQTRRLLATRLDLTSEEQQLAHHMRFSKKKPLLKRMRRWWSPGRKSLPALSNKRFQRKSRANYIARVIYNVTSLVSRLENDIKCWMVKRQSNIRLASSRDWQSAALSAFRSIRLLRRLAMS